MVKKRTIFIAHNWQDTSVARQSKEMALYFSQNNKVVFLNAKKKGIQPQQINGNLLLVNWPGSRPTGLRDFVFAIKLTYKYRPQVIISNFAANNIMLFVSWMFGVEKRVCYYHTLVSQYIADKGSLGIMQRLNIVRKNFFLQKATHILAVSSWAKQDVLKYYRVSEKNVYVFPNALPVKKVLNTGLETKRIGFVGRLNKSKGADILIEAFYKLCLQIQGLELIIAGGGEDQTSLAQQVERLGLPEKVVFAGSVPNPEICNFMASLVFLVVPSRIDNLPTVVLEAFSTATPVIAANVGGIPDMVQDGVNGLLFEGENVTGLCEKMKRLLIDNELRAKLAANGMQTFTSKYSLENLPARFEQLLA